jgi:hypothetical protein
MYFLAVSSFIIASLIFVGLDATVTPHFTGFLFLPSVGAK